MKKLISMFLTVAFVLSLGVAFAPASSADDALPELRPDAEVALVDGCLLGVAPGSSADDVAALFTENVHVIDHIGQDRTGDDLAATGWRVAAASASATVIICGDTSCDGKINVRDVVAVMKSITDGESLRFAASGDVSPDGAVNAKDVVALMRYLVGYDVTLGEQYFRVRRSALVAPDEDASLDLFFEDSLQKNSAQSDARTEERTFVMRLARNEKETCQAILFSEPGHKGLNASLTPFVNSRGAVLDAQLLFECYMRIVDDKKRDVMDPVPDCLPPVEAIGAFDVNAGERQGLYVEVSAAADTPAGLYRARLDLTDAGGKTVKSAYVYADVWDFEIPVESHLKSAFGMNLYGIVNRRAKGDDSSATELYTKYYEYMLDNRLNPWCMPCDPSSDEADVWMSDPRVNTFLVAGGYSGDVYNNMTSLDGSMDSGGNGGNVIDEAKVSAIYEKIKDNDVWMKKALFYCTDEPGLLSIFPNRDKFAEAFAQKDQLERCFPGARVIIPGSSNEWQDQYDNVYGWGHIDAMELTSQCSNVLCPKIDIYFPAGTPGSVYGAENESIYGKYTERSEKWRSEGYEMWWYTENAPWEPHVNISIRHTGMQNRMMLWESYKYDIEGFLYWSTTDWGPKKRNMVDRYAGLLVYPGDDYDVAGPVACQRTGIFRDGVEDMEYLYLAKELLGEEAANAYLARLVTDVVTFETDSAVLAEVRAELGDAIEAALGD